MSEKCPRLEKDTFQNELNQLEEVAPVRLAVDDVSMEVLGKLLEQNKERIGITSTEDGIFQYPCREIPAIKRLLIESIFWRQVFAGQAWQERETL